MKRLSIVLLLVSFAFGSPAPQNPTEAEKRIKQSVGSREYAAAIVELQKLRASDEKAFVGGDYDYLLGRMAEANGDLATAMSNFQNVADRDSVLSVYARKRLSQIARSTGNLMLGRIYLNEILMFSPDSPIAANAAMKLARNSFESGSYGETIRILTAGGTNTPKTKPPDSGDREIRALLGEAYLRNGQADLARPVFTELIDTVPNASQPDDSALAAAKGLDLLDVGGENFGKKVGNLTENEHQRRANIYQFNRDFSDAKLHFEALIANYTGGPATAEAIFQIGRGFAQQTNYVEALKWFERVIEQYPQSDPAKEALLHAASAYGRVVRPKEAMTRYQSFIDRFPADERLDRAYLNIVDILRDQGSDTDALKWCAKIRDTFKGKLPEAIALFTEARIHLARDEWQSALDALERLRSFNELGGSTVPGGTTEDEVAFLKGFVLEQLKKYPEAIETYLSIPDGRKEYYGWRATERLKLLANDETAKAHIAQKIGTLSVNPKAKDADVKRRNAQALLRLTDNADLREKTLAGLKAAIESLPAYKAIPVLKRKGKVEMPIAPTGSDQTAAAKLTSLGLYDEAAAELEAATPDMSKLSLAAGFELSEKFMLGDRADRVMVFIEPLWRKMPADYPIELIPREQLEMLYPTPYAGELLNAAPARKVDPRLMLAIMRQESRFQPDAKSYAAARGLMQFISTTATRVAGEAGHNNFRQDDLYDPATSILLGSHYLSDLFSKFPDQPDAVTASYNGGDDNMKRWLARAQSNQPERYVPEVVYSQSKDYVQKVMASYRLYRFLYDEQLRSQR